MRNLTLILLVGLFILPSFAEDNDTGSKGYSDYIGDKDLHKKGDSVALNQEEKVNASRRGDLYMNKSKKEQHELVQKSMDAGDKSQQDVLKNQKAKTGPGNLAGEGNQGKGNVSTKKGVGNRWWMSEEARGKAENEEASMNAEKNVRKDLGSKQPKNSKCKRVFKGGSFKFVPKDPKETGIDCNKADDVPMMEREKDPSIFSMDKN